MIDYINNFLDNFDKFAKFLDYDRISELQASWFKKLFLNKKELVILQAHRNSYKTTTIILSIVLLLLINPKLTFLIIRKSDELASHLCLEIQKIFKKQEVRFLFEKLYGLDFFKIKENQSTIDFNLSNREPTVLAVGVGKNLTGLHFDIIICDDIVTEKDRYSNKERENTKRFFYELKNILKKDSQYKKIVLTGTPWHINDLFSELSKKNEVFKYNVYETKIFNDVEILELRNNMPLSLFACNYELRHINDSECYFSNINFISNLDFLNKKVFMHIDAAFSGSDYTAVTICYVENNKYFVKGFCKRQNAFDLIDFFTKIIKDYSVIKLFIETNSDQGAITRELKKRVDVNIIAYKETRNKHLKILSILKKNIDRIYIDNTSDNDYIEQIISYSDFSNNDDAIDSLASIIGFLDKEKKAVFVA